MAGDKRRGPGRRVSVRVLVLRLLLVIVALALLQGTIYYRHYRIVKAKTYQMNLELARTVAAAFDDLIAAIHRVEAAVGYGLTSGAPMTHEQQVRLLRRISDEFPRVRDIAWMSAEGRAVACSAPEWTGRDLSNTPWFRQVEQGNDKLVTNTARKVAPGEDYFTAARAIRDHRGKLLGVVAAEISTAVIGDWFAIKRIPAGAFEVVDGSGWLVYRTDREQVPYEHRDWAAEHPLVRAALQGREVAGHQHSPLDGHGELVAEEPIAGLGWVVEASRGEREVGEGIRRGMAGDLTIVVLIAVAAALAALHTVRRITTPLAGLKRHAAEVGRGNLGHRVEVADTAELAEVGEAFNRMTEEAQAREHERELRLEAERERAALAEEISHQVRNNLAMVSGLLQMQLLKYRNTTVEPLLRAAVLRIQSFADIHEEIHAARSTELDLLSALRRLATSVSRRYAEGARPVISVDGDPLRYDARIVTNLAIAAGELMTNAVKYGGPGANGQVEVRVNCSAAVGELRLSVWSSGPPVPPDFDPVKQGAMGLQIVWDLAVSRYGGTFTLTPREGGSLAEIRVSEAALREKT